MILITMLALQSAETPKVSVPPPSWNLSPFYKKGVDLDGLPIVSSDKVPDAALIEAWKIGREMLRNLSDAQAAMIKNKVRIAIMSKDEQTLDIPEHSDLQRAFPQTDWNKRARGLGATRERPAISGAEENLLGYASDRYKGESIFIHEFAHAILDMGIATVDPSFPRRVRSAFDSARKRGLWEKTYAATNASEYWAEGVQSYFDCNRTAEPANGVHNWVGTRMALQAYDPELFALIEEAFRTKWRWKQPLAGKSE
jgi:alpha-glucosidase